MLIEQFDIVMLKDGRKGCVVEVLGDGAEFDVDVGDSKADWETITVPASDIASIIKKG